MMRSTLICSVTTFPDPSSGRFYNRHIYKVSECLTDTMAMTVLSDVTMISKLKLKQIHARPTMPVHIYVLYTKYIGLTETCYILYTTVGRWIDNLSHTRSTPQPLLGSMR